MSEGPTLLSKAQLKERGWKKVQVQARRCPDVSRAVEERCAAESVLERITANKIHHNLTVYVAQLREMAGQAGISEAGRVVPRLVYDEITAQYPEYAELYKGQTRDRTGKARDATG
jgi:hypothetical protein